MRGGDHIYTRRAGFTHHGIYIGNGQVIHYAGLSEGREAGPIEIAALEQFKSGRQARIKLSQAAKYTRGEIVERAYARLHERSHDLKTAVSRLLLSIAVTRRATRGAACRAFGHESRVCIFCG